MKDSKCQTGCQNITFYQWRTKKVVSGYVSLELGKKMLVVAKCYGTLKPWSLYAL